jgi:hypothetical protein
MNRQFHYIIGQRRMQEEDERLLSGERAGVGPAILSSGGDTVRRSPAQPQSRASTYGGPHTRTVYYRFFPRSASARGVLITCPCKARAGS